MPSSTCQVAITVRSTSFSARRVSVTTRCSEVQSASSWRKNRLITRRSEEWIQPAQPIDQQALVLLDETGRRLGVAPQCPLRAEAGRLGKMSSRSLRYSARSVSTTSAILKYSATVSLMSV